MSKMRKKRRVFRRQSQRIKIAFKAHHPHGPQNIYAIFFEHFFETMKRCHRSGSGTKTHVPNHEFIARRGLIWLMQEATAKRRLLHVNSLRLVAGSLPGWQRRRHGVRQRAAAARAEREAPRRARRRRRAAVHRAHKGARRIQQRRGGERQRVARFPGVEDVEGHAAQPRAQQRAARGNQQRGKPLQ